MLSLSFVKSMYWVFKKLYYEDWGSTLCLVSRGEMELDPGSYLENKQVARGLWTFYYYANE